MSYQGHCNCESIRVALPQQPANTGICYCDSCRRAGGGVSEDELTVEDSGKTLTIFDDKKSATGNIVKRHFCSSCGSPVFTKTPKAPGMVFLKAALFDTVSPPKGEVFSEKRTNWLSVEHQK
ncbi:hypothetical protein PENANT_c003G04286 [Penicillium antarcticum]|uniref:CENP-V/GFA domain-containing protein n=1 Tax=Penicillium antarcticum TaxID=416450 RepID=A0A1V6QHU4_9EURO|nr:hypothetical protein PENANT_c003G04286 [Penicillium antarcticum]